MVKQTKPVSEAQQASRAKASERMKARHEANRQRKAAEPIATVDDPVPEIREVSDPLDLTIGVKDDQWAAMHPLNREASRQAREDTRQGEGRQKRVPLGVPMPRLHADVPSGMTGRWTNDIPGRIERARQGGYEFISSDGEVVQNREGCRSEIVGTGRDGGAMRAFLMAVPTVLYEQDQVAKAALIKEGSDAIQRGKPQQVAAQDEGAFYTPSEGIKLRDEVR